MTSLLAFLLLIEVNSFKTAICDFNFLGILRQVKWSNRKTEELKALYIMIATIDERKHFILSTAGKFKQMLKPQNIHHRLQFKFSFLMLHHSLLKENIIFSTNVFYI